MQKGDTDTYSKIILEHTMLLHVRHLRQEWTINDSVFLDWMIFLLLQFYLFGNLKGKVYQN